MMLIDKETGRPQTPEDLKEADENSRALTAASRRYAEVKDAGDAEALAAAIEAHSVALGRSRKFYDRFEEIPNVTVQADEH